MSTEASETTPDLKREATVEAGFCIDKDSKKRSAEAEIETYETFNPADTSSNSSKKVCAAPSKVVIDKAVQLGLKPGDRIEVQWQIGNDDEDEDEEEEVDDGDKKETIRCRWWPATLLEHDGQSVIIDDQGEKVAVAIRVLDYDPYPEGGFPERSQEHVVFLGQGSIVDVETEERMAYRKQGEHYGEDDDQPVVLLHEHEMEEYVNTMMASLIEKHSDKFQKLPASVQAVVAERLSNDKSKFLDVLMQTKDGGVVTVEKMQELLAKAVSS
jgi:hypothetical protein